MNILINTLPNNQYVEIKVNYELINFYVNALHDYYQINGYGGTGLEKVAEQMITNLHKAIYKPCFNHLFDSSFVLETFGHTGNAETGYLKPNHKNDFDYIFSFIKTDIYDCLGDKDRFNAMYFIKLIENEINKLFVRIKTNRVKKAVYREIQQNDTFILDHKELEKVAENSNDETIHKIAKLIIDAPFTQLLSYFYFYEEKHIDYNLKNVFSIVKDIRSLITDKPFYDRLCSVIKYELVNTCNIK
jgi:hypothetical protein